MTLLKNKTKHNRTFFFFSIANLFSHFYTKITKIFYDGKFSLEKADL